MISSREQILKSAVLSGEEIEKKIKEIDAQLTEIQKKIAPKDVKNNE
jgi:uncharacterized membrane protein YukC